MCALVWERPGRLEDVAALVDQLLPIAVEHGARPERRWRRDDPLADADPAEMHMLQWEDSAFPAFRQDERVAEIMQRNRDVIASWQTVWVHQV